LSRQISTRPVPRNDLRAGGPMTVENSRMGGYSPRELLLAAAARAVLAAFREPLEKKRLTPPANATLRLLETALEPYPGANLDGRRK
jgi:hypothetical protein